jgi:hypothetical protein
MDRPHARPGRVSSRRAGELKAARPSSGLGNKRAPASNASGTRPQPSLRAACQSSRMMPQPPRPLPRVSERKMTTWYAGPTIRRKQSPSSLSSNTEEDQWRKSDSLS